jgi:hypothetical protein
MRDTFWSDRVNSYVITCTAHRTFSVYFIYISYMHIIPVLRFLNGVHVLIHMLVLSNWYRLATTSVWCTSSALNVSGERVCVAMLWTWALHSSSTCWWDVNAAYVSLECKCDSRMKRFCVCGLLVMMWHTCFVTIMQMLVYAV